ncbi:EthD family reductase [Nocardioides marmotae]|uniref:EthD family reductase n=1 Tax=Nocardioides marmotae TaxID=2663857 RepID=UPI001659A3CF|nr:EthD family reductase [Nocardioides marmotae]MBC9732351.1 EthD family reductase [Nocardioides marmotae]
MTIQYHRPEDPTTFLDLYKREHAPIAARVPGLRRYSVAAARGRGDEVPGLVAELWFDDSSAAKAALASSEMRAAVEHAETLPVERMVVFTGDVEDLAVPAG